MNDLPQGSNHYIIFNLNDTDYAIRSDIVQQMEMVEHVTPVPNARPFVEGVTFVRGQVTPVINLRLRFGFPRSEYDSRTRLIVVNNDGRRVGLIVDSAREFLAIDHEAIQPPPEVIADLSGHYLRGIAHIGERMVLVLDVSEILNLADLLAEEVVAEEAAVKEVAGNGTNSRKTANKQTANKKSAGKKSAG
jgi:purine-binding chemotaxis protein CheW